MGRKARIRQERLPEKLLQIRNALGLSQSEMLKRLGLDELIDYKRISEYELGNNEPPLIAILQYARAANVPMEVIVDDDLDLPAQLPGTANHAEIQRHYATRTRPAKKQR